MELAAHADVGQKARPVISPTTVQPIADSLQYLIKQARSPSTKPMPEELRATERIPAGFVTELAWMIGGLLTLPPYLIGLTFYGLYHVFVRCTKNDRGPRSVFWLYTIRAPSVFLAHSDATTEGNSDLDRNFLAPFLQRMAPFNPKPSPPIFVLPPGSLAGVEKLPPYEHIKDKLVRVEPKWNNFHKIKFMSHAWFAVGVPDDPSNTLLSEIKEQHAKGWQIWVDYACVPQEAPPEVTTELIAAAVSRIPHMAVHISSVNHDKYSRSAWCAVERRLAVIPNTMAGSGFSGTKPPAPIESELTCFKHSDWAVIFLSLALAFADPLGRDALLTFGQLPKRLIAKCVEEIRVGATRETA